MSVIAATAERSTGRVEDQGLLFEYTIKLVLIVGFFELVLYRLVSRLGMHISKIAAEHEWVGTTFQLLTSVGFALLNVVAIFVFLALVVLLLNRLRARGISGVHCRHDSQRRTPLDSNGRIPDRAAGYGGFHRIQCHYGHCSYRLDDRIPVTAPGVVQADHGCDLLFRHFRVAVLPDSFHHLRMDGGDCGSPVGL